MARYAYDAVADNPDRYAELRAALTDGPFVDMQKLYMGRGRGAPAPQAVDVDAILAEESET